MKKTHIIIMAAAGILVAMLVPVLLRDAAAHCDTLDGPVVAAAKQALESGDVTPVLKWVSASSEAEVRDAFTKTLVVRTKGPEAKELADMYFFETLVRLHRAGEGAPYTGLKPAGSELNPAVAQADKALESGSDDAVVALVTKAVEAGIRERFAHVAEAKKHADESVEAGRAFVAAYVEFVHYVERLFDDAAATHAHHADEAAPSAESEHEGASEEAGTAHGHAH